MLILQQPSSAKKNTVIPLPIILAMDNVYGDRIRLSGIPVTASCSLVPITGTLTRHTNSDGEATFDDISFDGVGGLVLQFVGTFEYGGQLDPQHGYGFVGITVLDGIGFNPPPADAILREYVSGYVPVDLSLIPVGVRLKNGESFFSFSNVAITVALDSGDGILIGESTLFTDNNGAVNFYLGYDTAGAKTLSATFELGNIISDTFNITGLLAFAQPPTTVFVGGLLSPAVTVQLKGLNRDGLPFNVKQAGFSISVELDMGDGILGGTLTRVTDSDGVATFDDLVVNPSVERTPVLWGMGLSEIKTLTASSDMYAPISQGFVTIVHYPVFPSFFVAPNATTNLILTVL